MPIKPENRDKYPKNWAYLRATVLFRAGNRCEGLPPFPDCRAVNYRRHPVTGSKVVLTIAHLTHDESCDDIELLRAACQRCHLTYDAAHHARNAAVTRRSRLASADLFAGAPA